MEAFAAPLAIGLFGSGVGWVALFSAVVAPVAFKDMDQGRANRHVRRVIKAGHGPLAVICFLGALAALAAGSVVGLALGALVGAFLLMCQWALAPRDDARAPPGGKRNLKSARIVAAGLTAATAPMLLAAAVLTALGV